MFFCFREFFINQFRKTLICIWAYIHFSWSISLTYSLFLILYQIILKGKLIRNHLHNFFLCFLLFRCFLLKNLDLAIHWTQINNSLLGHWSWILPRMFNMIYEVWSINIFKVRHAWVWFGIKQFVSSIRMTRHSFLRCILRSTIRVIQNVIWLTWFSSNVFLFVFFVISWL